jgi:ABC-2 type transport system ATP-binding protein
LKLRDQGKTVFLNSHLLGELERVCDRVAILMAGQVIRQGTIDELTAGSEHYEIEVGDDRQPSLADRIRQALPCQLSFGGQSGELPPDSGRLSSGETVSVEGLTVRVATGNAGPVQAVIDGLRARGLLILAVRPVRQSLEDYFLQTVTLASPAPGGQPCAAPPRALPTGENGGVRP